MCIRDRRAFIVTQSIKKLPAEDRAWALKKTGFKRLADDKPVDLTKLTGDDKNQIYYKDEPFTTKKLDQRLIITYSPKYAAYQKAIRAEQISRAEKMVANGSLKKQRKNPNDPARFVNKVAVTNAVSYTHLCLLPYNKMTLHRSVSDLPSVLR